MRQTGGNPRNIFTLTSSTSPYACLQLQEDPCLPIFIVFSKAALSPSHTLPPHSFSDKSCPIYKVEAAAQVVPLLCLFIYLLPWKHC